MKANPTDDPSNTSTVDEGTVRQLTTERRQAGEAMKGKWDDGQPGANTANGDQRRQIGRRSRRGNETASQSAAIEILLVEDHPQDLRLAQRALRKANPANRIRIARDGEEALEFIFCEGAHAARKIEDTPGLIVLDLKLPKVDGLAVLKLIKADPRTRAIPVVVLASSERQKDAVERFRLGVSRCILKPVNIERFVAVVQELETNWLLPRRTRNLEE